VRPSSCRPSPSCWPLTTSNSRNLTVSCEPLALTAPGGYEDNQSTPVGQTGAVNPALLERHLIRRADLHALSRLKRADEVARVQKAARRAGIKPGKAAPHPFHLQGPLGAVGFQKVDNLKLTPG